MQTFYDVAPPHDNKIMLSLINGSMLRSLSWCIPIWYTNFLNVAIGKAFVNMFARLSLYLICWTLIHHSFEVCVYKRTLMKNAWFDRFYYILVWFV